MLEIFGYFIPIGKRDRGLGRKIAVKLSDDFPEVLRGSWILDYQGIGQRSPMKKSSKAVSKSAYFGDMSISKWLKDGRFGVKLISARFPSEIYGEFHFELDGETKNYYFLEKK